MKIRTPSLLDFQLDQRFFGFDIKYQIHLHEQLFDLIWYGDGRWDWDTVYNLPIHIKRLWIKRYNERQMPNSSTESEQQQAEQLRNKFASMPKIAM